MVSISLKGVNSDTYEKAKAQLVKVINREARRLQFLMESEMLHYYGQDEHYETVKEMIRVLFAQDPFV